MHVLLKNLKLKLQCFGHLMRRVDSLEKTLMLGGIGGRRRRDDRGWDGWMASPTRWTWVWVNSESWWTGRPGVLWFMGSQRVGHDWATELNWCVLYTFFLYAKVYDNYCTMKYLTKSKQWIWGARRKRTKQRISKGEACGCVCACVCMCIHNFPQNFSPKIFKLNKP